MTYSVEYIVNTGDYEHALFRIEAPTLYEFHIDLDVVTAELLEKLGQLGALSKGAITYGYKNPDSVQSSTEELIKSELKAKVLETTQKPAELEPGPVAQSAPAGPSEAPSRPWKKQPEAKQDKPWTAGKVAPTSKPVKQAVDSDDFFD
jgi:hypothetical protein